MKRTQFSDCGEDAFLARTVDLSKRTFSERGMIRSLFSYLSENFRGAYYTGEILPGDGYLYFGAEGFAYGLRHLFRAALSHGRIGFSYRSTPAPVLCVALPANASLPDKIGREIRTVASYSDISFYGIGENRYCFRFDPAEKLHIAVYAPSEDLLLAALSRMLASIVPKSTETENTPE